MCMCIYIYISIYKTDLPFYCLFYFVAVDIQETMKSKRYNKILTPILSYS